MKTNQHRAFATGIRAALLVLLLFFSLVPGRAQAASKNFIVRRFDDPKPRTGGCTSDCTLREAIIAANANAGADTIYLLVGIYKLTLVNEGGTHESASKTGDLDITDDLTIIGFGPDPINGTAVYADRYGFGDRIFHVFSLAPNTHKTVANFKSLWIQGGSTNEPRGGGGILIENAVVNVDGVYLTGNNAPSEGGGITNYSGSTLSINTSTFDNNTSNDGGGIYNVATLKLENSLLYLNVGSVTSGGVDNGSGGTATITNVTFSENSTSGDKQAGGAISNSGTLTLKNATFADNSGTALLLQAASKTYVSNSIFSQGAAPFKYANCGTMDKGVKLTSLGHNMVFGNPDNVVPTDQYGCTWEDPTDLKGFDPYLGTLGVNGYSPTKTYDFTDVSSKAIDYITDTTLCPKIDQRLYPRYTDGNEDGTAGCDIGAFEVPGEGSGILFVPFFRR